MTAWEWERNVDKGVDKGVEKGVEKGVDKSVGYHRLIDCGAALERRCGHENAMNKISGTGTGSKTHLL